MAVSIEISSEKKQEQINDNIEYIFEGIKSILEKDEFGIFELKANHRINEEFDRTDEEIQKLIKISNDRRNANHELSDIVTQIKTRNELQAQSLLEEMDYNAN